MAQNTILKSNSLKRLKLWIKKISSLTYFRYWIESRISRICDNLVFGPVINHQAAQAQIDDALFEQCCFLSHSWDERVIAFFEKLEHRKYWIYGLSKLLKFLSCYVMHFKLWLHNFLGQISSLELIRVSNLRPPETHQSIFLRQQKKSSRDK